MSSNDKERLSTYFSSPLSLGKTTILIWVSPCDHFWSYINYISNESFVFYITCYGSYSLLI